MIGIDGTPMGGRPILVPLPAGQFVFEDESGVVYQSRGCVLVAGPARLALPAARQLASSLRVVACVADAATSTGPNANPAVIIVPLARIEGRLGHFAAFAGQAGDALADLGPFSANSDHLFDLVLDFGSPRLLSNEVPPIGYFAPGDDAGEAARAIAEAKTLVGAFRKPRYFHYERSLCAHSAKGITGCTRCLDACPAGAIRSSGGLLDVDPYLCQGCSTCALVCPTGAIAYAAPLPAFPAAPSRPDITILRIHQNDDPPVPAADVISAPADDIALPAIAAAGVAEWLGALANGYASVVVQIPPGLPRSTELQLAGQLELARSLLGALGQQPDAIAFASGANVPATASADRQPSAAIAFVPDHDSRAATLSAIDALELRIDVPLGTAPWPLQEGAPFGAVEVSRDACTLCMACVNLCPTAALTTADLPRSMHFTESRCVQCGLCSRGCPEQAITLVPRLLPRRAARDTTRVLNKDRQHSCPECRTPFIGMALLTRAMQVMRDSDALEESAIDALKLCPACRAEAMQ